MTSMSSVSSMQVKNESLNYQENLFPPKSKPYPTSSAPQYYDMINGSDILNFLKSATINSVKQETCEKPFKRRKRIVHPSKHIIRNMSEEGLECGAYAKRRVGRRPRPNVIPDEVMKSEDYFDPLVEALFTDASKVERLPDEAFRTPEKDGTRGFPNPPRLRGRPPKRKATNEVSMANYLSQANLNYNNNNNNSNNNNNNSQYTVNSSQQCFSDPALANILRDELPFLTTSMDEIYTNTLQTNCFTPAMQHLALQTPKSPKKLRPTTERPCRNSCRRKIEFTGAPAFEPNPIQDFLLPPPTKRICTDSPVPPLPTVNAVSYPYPATDLIPSPVDPIPLQNFPTYPHSAPYSYYTAASPSTDGSFNQWPESYSTSYSASTVEAPYDQELDLMLDLLGQSQTFYSNNGILVE